MSLVAELVPQTWFSSRRRLATGVSRAALAAGGVVWPPVIRAVIGELGGNTRGAKGRGTLVALVFL